MERQTCNLTMTYGLKTARHNKQAVRDEIVVMQQHTTGENSVVYKGFLAEGGKYINQNKLFEFIFIFLKNRFRLNLNADQHLLCH